MAKYIAGEVVEPLDYDLSAVGGPSGTIKEPSSDQVDDYNYVVMQIREEIRQEVLRLTADSKKAEEAADTMDLAAMREQGQAVTARIIKATAELCSGSPSEEQLQALPYRHQMAFFGWLTGELAPKGSMSVMTGSPEVPATV